MAGERAWNYFNMGVWEDSRHTWRVGLVKTLNLSMRSFLNSQLWVRAASLTYNTVLAIVPALALVFAICRGFGFQNLLESQLHHYFPAQGEALTEGLKFVDSYLNTSSEGVFVGAGIIFLLWTLFSLMSNVEDAFNEAWNVKTGRTLWRQITDYTAIFFLLPVLMICSSGITIVMSTTLQTILPWGFLQSALSWILDLVSLALIWLFFTGTFLLIPNTRVKFRNAFIAGIFAGTGFIILQWIFVTGQMYVARYNAIYGSFSFVPLLLIWLQLVWLLTLAGAVVCYAMQNIYNISYLERVAHISTAYSRRVSLAVMSVVVNAFRNGLTPPTPSAISHDYGLPANLVSPIAYRLTKCGMLRMTIPAKSDGEPGLLPAVALDSLTVSKVLIALDSEGTSDFIPNFAKCFPEIDTVMAAIGQAVDKVDGDTLVQSLKINKPKANNNL